MARGSNPPKEDLKGWAMLQQYAALRKKLADQEERLEALRETAYGLSSVIYDGMPRGTPSASSHQERTIIRLEELEERKKATATEEAKAYNRLSDLLDALPPDEELVLTMRYLDGHNWNTINRALYGNLDEFDEYEEKYKKRTFRIHSEALRLLEALIMENDLEA